MIKYRNFNVGGKIEHNDNKRNQDDCQLPRNFGIIASRVPI